MDKFEKQFLKSLNSAYQREFVTKTGLERLLTKKPYRRHKTVLPKQILSVYFGVPGAGKTTFAAYLTRHDLKRGIPVWSNVPITGAYKLEPKDDIGKYMI